MNIEIAARIWAGVMDRGGLNGLLPVVQQLRQRGHTVHLFATRGFAAAEYLHSSDIAHEVVSSDEPICGPWPDLFISSMCHEGNIGTDIIRKLRSEGWNGKVVALADYCGGALKMDWANLRPHLICVNDPVECNVVKRAWPEFDPAKIAVTGYPAFDRYAGMQPDQSLKDELGLDRNLPVVTFIGDREGTGALCEMVVQALDELGPSEESPQPVSFFPRPRPSMRNEVSEEEYAHYVDAVRYQNGPTYTTGGIPTDRVLAISDIVIGSYSTCLTEAGLLRKVPINLAPYWRKEWYIKGTGGLMEEFPAVGFGACAEAASVVELKTLLRGALKGDLAPILRGPQETFLRTDGENTERVVARIENLLTAG